MIKSTARRSRSKLREESPGGWGKKKERKERKEVTRLEGDREPKQLRPTRGTEQLTRKRLRKKEGGSNDVQSTPRPG